MSSGSLLAISIGPVQEFIAAARRTRDLWFGSHVLSELSKAAACEIVQVSENNQLIFPSPESPHELEPDSELAVANIILAQLAEDSEPSRVVERARAAVQSRWQDIADEASRRVADIVMHDVWSAQVADVVEFYAAWIELGSDYKQSRSDLMRLLAGRKACRNFEPAKGIHGLPKSSLDGARETVLRQGTSSSTRLLLTDGEQLDAIGVIKRLGGGKSYPSVARVAAEPWVEKVEQAHLLSLLIEVCEPLARERVVRREQDERYSAFPYDGELVFVNRHKSIAEEVGASTDKLTGLSNVMRRLARSSIGEPFPYSIILLADGDRMGQLIGECNDPSQHRNLSRGLSLFAKDAHSIVKRYKGVCVYAGGDDVLAFLPLHQGLECARRLRQSFTDRLCGHGAKGATISVGLALGHFMEPLEDLLNLARDAEKLAKKENAGAKFDDPRFGVRDGLGVIINPRGGAPILLRERWQGDNDNSLDRRLNSFSLATLPHRLAYDLRHLADLYKDSYPSDGNHLSGETLRADIRLLLKRKNIDDRAVHAHVAAIVCPADLQRFADELLVAQWFAQEALG